MPATHLCRVQIGYQPAFTTPVSATALLQGVIDGSILVQHKDEVVRDPARVVGDLMVSSQRYAEGNIKFQATYENILYALFDLFLSGIVIIIDYIYYYFFSAPYLSYGNPYIYTIEYGTTGAEYRVVGAIIKEWTLTYDANDGVKETWGIIGQRVQAHAMTSNLPGTGRTPILSRHASFYMDHLSAAHGTTAIPGTVISAELTVNTNRHLKMFENSNPIDWGEGRWKAELKMTLEFNQTAKEVVDSLLSNNTARKIRMLFTYGIKEIRIDFVGALTKSLELFSDRDGSIAVELTWSALVDPQFGNWLKIGVVHVP